MKVVRFRQAGGEPRLGFLVGETVVAPILSAQLSAEERSLFRDTVSFINSGERGISLGNHIVRKAGSNEQFRLSDVTLAAPIVPSTILCSGSNYRDHNAEKANAPTSGKEPEFFIKSADSVVGPNDFIIHDPALTMKLDCETELAIVIGKSGRHIPLERALTHVFGYTICNDVTARDRQVRRADNGTIWYDLGRGKAFDTSACIGPCIVTADEIGDPQRLHLSTRINGELRQNANTSEMIWNCASLIHSLSVNFTLKPGMVIITGTPAGTAWSTDKELGGTWTGSASLIPATRYCMPGDLIECTIDKIGTLTNSVTAFAETPTNAYEI
ncbi:fumarylacetoacetate hydrolase family protein [Bradyrhizobium jicamae]|uniref:fumarylacetoacetate hydrolase family protein n=1 Tax=Bradyrhizobium jicamae TaxID=280332 RepID=UPI001BAA1FF0|nr:fumarylacetoacetate hydrolase family protein [Bradyrhizobium jicamae]MBR0934127.1 fumarylacetoacetate hydrolase family protein [Bradyrhizobium jicamae]